MTEPIDPVDPDAPIVDDQPIPYRRGRPFGIRSDILQKLQDNTVTQRQVSDIVEEGMGHLAQMRDTLAEADEILDEAGILLEEARDMHATIPAIIEEGRGHVADALASAELASGHVSAAQTLVAEAKALVDEAEVLNEDIKATFQQMQLLRQQATKSVRVASGQAAQAIVHAGEAHRFVEQARSYNTQIAAYVSEAQAAVVDGRGHAQAAQAALTSSTALLADIDGEGTNFNTAVTQVLVAHNGAITSANNAATSALNAANANTNALNAMQSANDARDTAITKAADAGRDAGLAAQSLSDAMGKVIEAQGILEDNQAIQTEINTKHGQAIKAAARAAGQASMAAMQATETARSAALAADKALDAAATLTTVQGIHTEILGKHGEVLEKHSQAISQAGNAAQSALEAVTASNLAQQTGWERLIVNKPPGTQVRFVNDDYVTCQYSGNRAEVTINKRWDSDWAGEIWAKAYYENNTVQPGHSLVPLATAMVLGGGNTPISHVDIEYRRNHGIPQKRTQHKYDGWQLPTNNEWHQFDTGEPWKISMTQTAAVTVLFRVGWDAAGYNGGYSLQARVNNVGVVTVTNNGLGPQYIWQDSGYREQVLARSGNAAINVPAGQELTFWVRRDRVGATTAPQERKIRNFDLTAVWIDPPA